MCELPQQKDITLVFCLLARKGEQHSCFQALYALFLMSRAPGIIGCRSLEWTQSSPVHEINEDLKFSASIPPSQHHMSCIQSKVLQRTEARRAILLSHQPLLPAVGSMGP